MLLENQIYIENSSCPYHIDEGLEIVKVYDDGNNVVYKYRMDENIYNVATFKYTQSDLKNIMSEGFNDPSMKKQIEIFKSLNKGLVYHYYGDKSGESVKITFTADELRQHSQGE